MSGRDQCYALPELQQWETAKTENYVWGDPAAIGAYGKALDTAGTDLGTIADSLGGMTVADFWTGPAATAFTELKSRLTPAVTGLATMQKEAAAALDTWQRHLSVYQEDCGTAITTGKQGWALYKTTSCDNADAQTKMTNGKTGITTAQTSSMSGGRTCKAQLEAAATKADVSTTPPTPATSTTPGPISTTPGQVGTAPSGREPVPFTGPVPAGQPRPWVDPANGKVVVPRPGPWAVGKQPWDYADGSPAPGAVPGTTPPTTTPPTTTPPTATAPSAATTPNQPWIVSTTPGQVGSAPSGQEPVPFTGPIATGQPRPWVDPANGRVVIPKPGPWAIGKQPWEYAS